MKFLCILVILAIPVSGRAQDAFKLPDNPKGIIVDYLEGMRIANPSRQLSEGEKHELCRLFVKAYAISVRRHRQDYLLQTSAPVYRLLVTNFPAIKAKEGEGGSVIFLGTITRFFNKAPEYRNDVLQILRTGVSGKYCDQP